MDVVRITTSLSLQLGEKEAINALLTRAHFVLLPSLSLCLAAQECREVRIKLKLASCSCFPFSPVIVSSLLSCLLFSCLTVLSGECMSVFSGHSGAVNCGAWSADGKQLITCGESGDLIVWNPKTGEAAIHLKGQKQTRGESRATEKSACSGSCHSLTSFLLFFISPAAIQAFTMVRSPVSACIPTSLRSCA